MNPDAHAALLTDRNLDAGRGDAIALVAPDGSTQTFAHVHRDACRVAARLRDRGVRRGERVLLVMDDSPCFHAAFLGAMRAGAVPVPTNFLARSEDFAFFMADAYAVLAIVDAVFLETVAPQADARGVPVVVGNGAVPEHEALSDWIAEGPDHVAPLDTHPDDPAFWLYSSGSTGKPKGVVHSQRDIAVTCRNYARGVLGLTAQDRCFSTTKLFHAYGLGNGLSFPLWVGACAVQLGGRPTPEATLAKIETHRPSMLFSVPALYNAMLASPDIETRDLSSLRLGASAAEALPAEIWRQWLARTGTEILDGIGSTEMLHIYCSNRRGEVVPGSSGTPVPGYDLQLRDEAGQVLTDPEAVGDLYVAGDSRLAQYWHRKHENEKCLHGRWFFTGDRYRRSAEGTYAYEGRADDMMKIKGLWVSPIDIENRLIEHPMVREAAVVGVMRDNTSTIKAFVICTEAPSNPDALAAELQQWCKQTLLRYQFPAEIDYVDDLPRTTTGKVQRFRLRAE